MPKYCKGLVGQVCVTLWCHGMTGKGSWMHVVLDILYNLFRKESRLNLYIRNSFTKNTDTRAIVNGKGAK